MKKLARKKLSLSRAVVLDLIAATGGAAQPSRGCATDGACRALDGGQAPETNLRCGVGGKLATIGNKQISKAGYYCPSEFPSGEYKKCGGK